MKKDVYLVTCSNGVYNSFVNKFYNKKLAEEEYKRSKKQGYSNVKLSKVIK